MTITFSELITAGKIGLSDTAIMDMMISSLQQQKRVTEQLRREAALKRMLVSQAAQDIIKFINDHQQEDCLLVGFSSQKANPFREKSSCNVL
jgi:guanine nucleotide-binding protein G(I)/G(S)/G(O) subunit gamma-12